MWHSNRVGWNYGLTSKTDNRVKYNVARTKNGILIKYGVDNIAKVPSIMRKMVKTRKQVDNYGLGVPKPGTSQKLKGVPKSKEHCKHISDAVKRQYQENPKRRELSRKIVAKLIARNHFTSFPQIQMFNLIKKFFPNAKLEYKITTSKGRNRFLDVAIPSLKLDFEYDGFIHTYLNMKQDDELRDKELATLGWKTIRVDKELLKNFEQYLASTVIPLNSFSSNLV